MDSYDFANDPLGLRRSAALAPDAAAHERALENLLLKVSAAWEVGDDARAARFLDRIAASAFDRHEQMWPGLIAAHMLLFELLTHTLETGDSSAWFAAVEATYATATAAQRDHLSDSLAPLISDWDLGPGLERLVRTLVADGDEDRWMDPDLAYGARRTAIEEHLQVTVRLSEELAARGLCSHLRPEHW